jgi:hypothetical protein
VERSGRSEIERKDAMMSPRHVSVILVVLAFLTAVGALAACAPSAPPVVQGTAPQQGGSARPAPQIPADAPRGAAVSLDGAQTISVDVSQGFFNPMVIDAKAGEPLAITFGQGQGCMAKVLINDFGVSQDLTSGGAVVKLPAMKAGEYTFSCGMEMQFGKIVVK